MKLPLFSSLSFYIIKRFYSSFAIIFFIFIALTAIVDSTEIARRLSEKTFSFFIIFKIVMYRLPASIQDFFPFIILLATLLTFLHFNRTSEITVMRATGLSIVQILTPLIFTIFLFGIISSCFWNPISSSFQAHAKNLLQYKVEDTLARVTLDPSGLWLREKRDEDKILIHAMRVAEEENTFKNVSFFIMNEKHAFDMRIDAEEATLLPGMWELHNVIITKRQSPSFFQEYYTFNTHIDMEKIRNNIAPPDTISFWHLPLFIKTLKEAGMSIRKYVLHWHIVASHAVLYVMMLVIGSLFLIDMVPRYPAFKKIILGIFTGFLFYFCLDMAHFMGLSGKISIVFAVWGPLFITGLLAISILIHSEER